MNIKSITAVALASLYIANIACADNKAATAQLPAPAPVQKKEQKKVYMHMMTWFETKETNRHPDPKYVGGWGCHWSMDTCNPDSIVDQSTGRRQIASHYYPLTGPYSSGDKDIIEYQLLLMKLAGIDGIIFDYTTMNPAWDYPMLTANTDSIERQTRKIGLDYCILYEDQHLRDAAARNELTVPKIERAKMDMKYIIDRYISQPNYIKIDGRPLLLDFGPQTFETEAEWDEIFSVFGDVKPEYYTLWYESKDAGNNATGEYAWIWKNHLGDLNAFYGNDYKRKKIGCAYPGFRDFYREGNWDGGIGWGIPHHGTKTLRESLDASLKSDVDIIQLATWNDYGEGTMFEPTAEFGFSFLSELQKQLGVENLNESDLELVYDLYKARKSHKDSPEIQSKLDEASALMAALKTAEARKIIESVGK